MFDKLNSLNQTAKCIQKQIYSIRLSEHECSVAIFGPCLPKSYEYKSFEKRFGEMMMVTAGRANQTQFESDAPKYSFLTLDESHDS